MSLSPASWFVGAGFGVRGGVVGGGVVAMVGVGVGVSGRRVNVGMGVGVVVGACVSLGRVTGCGARQADSAAALRLVHATRPDVLVLDSDMTDLGGLEVAETLRRDGTLIRIVLYTLDGDACVRAREIGVDACITKDSAPSLLIDAIRGGAPVVSTPPAE